MKTFWNVLFDPMALAIIAIYSSLLIANNWHASHWRFGKKDWKFESASGFLLFYYACAYGPTFWTYCRSCLNVDSFRLLTALYWFL